LTWNVPQRVNPGSTTDHVDHYGVGVAVGAAGSVHVAYRRRDESGQGPRYTPVIDTYYQESRDGGGTFTVPLGRQGPPAPERLGRASPGQALKNCVRGLRGMPRT